MGRSKFPGKPSKLVTKKRVSVLNGNNINNSSSGSVSSGSGQNVATTISSAVGCIAINNSPSNNGIDADADTQNIAVERQSNNNIEPDSDIALRSTAAKCDVVQVNH